MPWLSVGFSKSLRGQTVESPEAQSVDVEAAKNVRLSMRLRIRYIVKATSSRTNLDWKKTVKKLILNNIFLDHSVRFLTDFTIKMILMKLSRCIFDLACENMENILTQY